jgi:hypothetical protein
MRRLVTALCSALLLVACGGSSTPTTAPTTAPLTAPQAVPDTAPLAVPDTAPAIVTTPPEQVEANSAEQIEVDRPFTSQPGQASLALLTKAEVCALVPDDEAKTIWGMSTDLTLKGWTQTDQGSGCSQIFNDEPTDGVTPNILWELTRAPSSSWPQPDADYKRTVEDTKVGGRQARVVTAETSELGGEDIDVFVAVDPDISLNVSVYGDPALLDQAKLLTLADRILGRISSLKPTVEPAQQAPVADVFDLTSGQLCSLLRSTTAASLLADNRPSGTSSYLLTEDSASCSIGSAKLGLSILSTEPFSIDDTTRSPATLGSITGVWDKPSLEGGKADPGADVQFVSLLVKWRDVWVEVQARIVQNTPEVERLVGDEMLHILDQLETVVKPA